MALLRTLLECGYYSREGLIWGNTVIIFLECGPPKSILHFSISVHQRKLFWKVTYIFTPESRLNMPLRLSFFGFFTRGYSLIMDLKDLNFTTEVCTFWGLRLFFLSDFLEAKGLRLHILNSWVGFVKKFCDLQRPDHSVLGGI